MLYSEISNRSTEVTIGLRFGVMMDFEPINTKSVTNDTIDVSNRRTKLKIFCRMGMQFPLEILIWGKTDHAKKISSFPNILNGHTQLQLEDNRHYVMLQTLRGFSQLRGTRVLYTDRSGGLR